MKYYKKKLSTWLLIVTMLLSFFAFSGYSNNSTLLNNKKTQTELVCSIKTKTNKIAGAFKKTVTAFHKHVFYNYFNDHSTRLLLIYNNLIKVKLDSILKLYQSIDQTDKFIQLKNIPRNSSKDIFIFIGSFYPFAFELALFNFYNTYCRW